MLGGDTVSSIARRYHISADDLMKRNGIEDPTRLRVGQTLTLPADAKVPKSALAGGSGQAAPAAAKPAESKTTATPPAAATRSSSYKVQRGDTLYGIARKHKMSMANLKALNPRIESKIMVGQSLTVSGQPRSSSTTSSTSSQVRGSSPGATPPVSKKSVASKQPAKKPAPPATKSESPPAPSLANSRNDEPKAVADSKPEPRTISSILVMDEISFGDFAEKHGTTPEQLNALNGWDFNHDLVLARGSEIYVPGQ
ncbi:MAG: LysM peptidoglycan-binding domain-containing protein [Akkermansiaceae bacterium]|nr:LysM peptidoglycan-binding domain-containing protein [Akkermansiaceae bacterium]